MQMLFHNLNLQQRILQLPRLGVQSIFWAAIALESLGYGWSCGHYPKLDPGRPVTHAVKGIVVS